MEPQNQTGSASNDSQRSQAKPPQTQRNVIAPRQVHRYERYRPLCITGLMKALDPATRLYDRQLRSGRWESTIGTEDLTSTCICLIGVHRSGLDPSNIQLDPRRTLDAAVSRARARRYPGGLGLLVWANAVWDGPEMEGLIRKTGLSLGTDGYGFASRLTTMESAWLLSGLLHEHRRRPTRITREITEGVLRDLMERKSEGAGVMPHARRTGTPRHRMRAHIANFADQIYSIQALSFAALVLSQSRAADAARELGRRIVELQGPLGQWWWHYDSRGGAVSDRFPVYSVHQHAMAPMALMALEAAGGGAFGEAIDASHEWLTHNELAVSMVDENAETIWRDVERDANPVSRTVSHAQELLGLHGRGEREWQSALVLNRETRPYEWAWCLYAGAIDAGLNNEQHIV
ncbi:MAG: hypothetical protein WBV82_08260 [Myxococcaceae bacterium]